MLAKPQIMIVDDEIEFQTLLAKTLETEGFDVTTASNGDAAAQKVREQTYDLALLNLKMVGLTGLELLKVLRCESPTTDCIVVAGYQELDLAIEAIRMGAKEFISKPSNIDDLVNRIKTIVRAHTAEANMKKMQVEFTSKLLHDLLTPLHTIKSAIDYIESEVSEQLAEQHKNVFRGIEKSIKSVDALLNDMIDLSLFESGKVDIEKLPADLDELIPAICTQFFPRTNAKRIEMLIRVNENVPTTPLDADKIEQVMHNLLDNSIKFTPRGGTIKMLVRPIEEVAGDQKQEFVEVVVSDTGAGIAPDELLFIFDKYKNFLAGKTSQQKTTGLGLVICQSIVEAHDGKISTEPTLGKGSRFEFMLPTDSMN